MTSTRVTFSPPKVNVSARVRIEHLEKVSGYTRRHWLHVPIGVGLFGGLMRELHRLDTLRRTAGATS